MAFHLKSALAQIHSRMLLDIPPRTTQVVAVLLASGLLGALTGCGRAADKVPDPAAASNGFYASPFEKHPGAAELTSMGRALFSDPALSASGVLSCASCHDPAHAYSPANDKPVQMGGPDLHRPGLRAAPSLTYQQDTPPFSEHFNDADGDDGADQGPTGGRGWDGRVFSAHEQAALPLLSPFEMANTDKAQVIARLRRSSSAEDFRRVFGDHALDDVSLAWNGVLMALEVFQQSPADFYPYSSKYDAFLRRQTELSPSEQRGLALFNDPAKGNCAGCHPSAMKRGAFPQFTDRGFVALGVPRNPEIPANADPRFYDLGLCGPLRIDLEHRPEYCGLFKTPSLRNVAMRSRFFHNGAFRRLEDVLDFYAERDLYPERFYARDAAGKIRKFDDLSPSHFKNVNTDAPFGRRFGQRPRLSGSERADIAAFLQTLTDGYRPDHPKIASQ